MDTLYIFLLGYRVLFCVESLSSQSKHCTCVSPSASSQLKSWVSDTSHLSQQTEEGSPSSVICSTSAASLQPLVHDVCDKMRAQHTAELRTDTRCSNTLQMAHPAQWELPWPRWSCGCQEWWPGRRRHLSAAPSHLRSSGSHSPALECWRHQWTCGLSERAAELGYKAVQCIQITYLNWIV